VKYAWIQEQGRRWPTSVMCRVLDVSESGYYHHCTHVSHRSCRNDVALLTHIRAIHRQVKGEYGWPRMWKALQANGTQVSKERVRKLMQQYHIQARGKRKFVVTTDSKHNLPIAPNLLQRNFTTVSPNQVWTGDITYIQTGEGWLYLAVVLDLFSRQVVGFSMQPHMRSSLVTDALRMAWFRRKPLKSSGLIFHSDRGSQYCSEAYQAELTRFGIQSSMSRKGDCWDNAPTESLWGSLKVGRLHGRRFATRREAMDEVIDWLTFYNHSRLHSTLNYLSPMQFEARWLAEQRKKSA